MTRTIDSPTWEPAVKKTNDGKEDKNPPKDRKKSDWLTRKIFEDLEKGFKIRVSESSRPKP
jgi:hypothetical protein